VNTLPNPRSMAMVSGTPSMRLSPFQMTPSQSKINVSTESTKGFLSPSCRIRGVGSRSLGLL